MSRGTACAHIHLLAMALLGGVVLFINASSSDNPLRAQDRDLFTLLRADHPELLRGLDLRSPSWHPLPLADLSGIDLSGLDLRGLRLSKRAVRHVNLQGSHLEQAEFTCVPMGQVSLAGANLREAHFDYRACDPSKGTQELAVDLNGADLSQADLRGGREIKNKACNRPLRIKGNLNGARFEGATLDCVVLINTSKAETWSRSSPPPMSSPRYGGIHFVRSAGTDLVLSEGDFVFSDFYKARLGRLAFHPGAADLRFSTLAELNCPPDPGGCEILREGSANEHQKTATGAQLLSLNVRGSGIISNLPLPNKTSSWPALLCDATSRIRSPGGTSSGQTTVQGQPDITGFWILENDRPRCAEPTLTPPAPRNSAQTPPPDPGQR